MCGSVGRLRAGNAVVFGQTPCAYTIAGVTPLCDDPEPLRALGRFLVVAGAIYAIAARVASGVYFEPWPLIVVATGGVILTLARVRAGWRDSRQGPPDGNPEADK